MLPTDFDLKFWVAVVGAALVRVATSENHSLVRSVVTVATAVFVAWVFTDAALDWFSLPVETYRNPMAALLALTGEGVARLVINLVNDPLKAVDLWNKWRGK
jgi:hypothetical protein